MRKIVILLLCVSLLCPLLSSCRADPDAYSMLSSFINTYGAEGTIYSPNIHEGNPGYVYDGLMEKIYLFSGDFPTNYAVFLNGRTDTTSECAIFVCSDAEMMAMVEEMCLERIRLLSFGGDHAFVKRSSNICFYSTLQDRARAEKIFSQIIR
ncbi:MAG: hypothetical protein J6V80_05715 [Clostridia bacterium]|nr:hypothetical protein [Clostridia bacterium]